MSRCEFGRIYNCHHMKSALCDYDENSWVFLAAIQVEPLWCNDVQDCSTLLVLDIGIVLLHWLIHSLGATVVLYYLCLAVAVSF